jgi:hypothetical protein
LHLPADLHDPRGIPRRCARAVPGKRRLNARAEYQLCDLYIVMRRLTQAVSIKAHAGMHARDSLFLCPRQCVFEPAQRVLADLRCRFGQEIRRGNGIKPVRRESGGV